MKLVQFQQSTAILGKEHTLPILEELFIQPWSTASEIASELSIHIATAVKYLDHLTSLNILESRVRKTKARNAMEYNLRNPNIILNLDISSIVEEKAEAAYEQAKRIQVKENVKVSKNYEWDEDNQRIIRINVLKSGQKRRRVEVQRSIVLTELEGKFFWNLPYASEAPKSVIEVCTKSGITEKKDILKIVEFIRMLIGENILEWYEIQQRGVL
ncbi:MAG: hypothetical protein JSV49_04385 [Thermoplasmata archaeon]|nr:MAG: hypothetical protein JSV49_04385 [Thermoplasmata archaeon]